MAVTKVRIQMLSKSSTDFATQNPVLLDGEAGIANSGTNVPTIKIGDGVRPWSALPDLVKASANLGYVVGSVTTLPPGSNATVTINNTVSPPTISFGIPQGQRGPPGVQGPQGIQGPIGPPNVLTIGTVTTGAPGSAAAASITGTSPNQTLNLTIPTGAQGPKGDKGDTGDQGVPGSAALENPSKLVGLTVKNGSAGFAMYADAAPAIDQAIAPTWTGSHVFNGDISITYAVPGVSIGKSASDAYIALYGGNTVANGKRWDIQAESSGTFHIRCVNDAYNNAKDIMAASRSGYAVTAMSFGNATDNPLFTFFGGRQVLWAPAGLDARIELSANNGANGLAYIGQSGSAGAVITGAVAGDMHLRTPSKQILFSVDAGATIAVKVAVGNTLWAMHNFVIGGGLTSTNLYMSSSLRVAMADLGDAYLRLNDQSQYTNGIYTPGKFRASGVMQGDTSFDNADSSKRLIWNGGGLSYGTAYITGAVGAWHGLAVYDTTTNLTLMGNAGGSAGLYSQVYGKWLLNMGSSTTAQCDLTLTAAAFNVNSARALKRETGKPSRVADMLAKLRPILYRLLEGDEAEQLGMIAEEVHEVCPQLSNGKTVSYDRLAILLLADWQERHALI